MAKNKKSQIPNNIKQVFFRTILDFKRAYDINPENAQEKIEFFDSVLEEDEINLFTASKLFSHFTELKEFCYNELNYQNIPKKVLKSLIKDSEIVLDYLNQNFEIKGNQEGHMISEKKVA